MRPSPPSASRRARVTSTLALSGILIVAALVNASTASAIWSASLSATGSVAAGTLGVSIDSTLPTATLTNSTLSSTGSVAISNTTTFVGAPPSQLALTLEGPASSQLAAATQLIVWPAQGPAPCSSASVPSADAVTGTWASVVTLSIQAPPPGSTQSFCVRSTDTSRQEMAAATGSLSFDGSIEARLTLHSFSAVNDSSTTLGTAQIFPFGTLGDHWYNLIPAGQTICLDVTGGVTASPGVALGTYTCHSSLDSSFANQWFTLAPISGSLVGIRSAVQAGLYAQANPNGTVTMQARNASDRSQSWEPQLVGSGTFQFVNDLTGICLSAPPSAGPLSVSECTGGAGQTFTATELPVAGPSDSGNGS